MLCQFCIRIGATPNSNPDPTLLAPAPIVISCGCHLKQQRQHQNIRDTETKGSHGFNESQDAPQ